MPNVEFKGGFPPEELERVLGEIDVLVLPSIWYENNPIVILEALAAVTPIATQDLSTLLVRESPKLPWGATLIVVTANVNQELNSTLLRLRAAGRQLVLISLSPDPPDPLVSQEVLTYHLPDAASPYQPLETDAARQLTPATQRDSILAEWMPARPEREMA